MPAPGEGQGPQEDVRALIAAIDAGEDLARTRSRPDLSQRLEQARRQVVSRIVTVGVVGEFKRGKSTLVNALIQTAACPVDADIVTAVPTLVRYGERLEILAHRHPPGDAEPVTERVPPEALAELVSERPGRLGDPVDVQTVEVRVPHRILRTGLRLLDTPGVGGLESAHGQITLASLSGLDAFLFVTDASQELTAPEMDFLRSALERCPSAAVVVTKTDLHQHWRRIVELDREHLARAGLSLPVFGVSSFLRLRAARRPELNAESGFAPLVDHLGRDVVRRSTARTAAGVAHQVDFVVGQLAREADAERVVLAKPEAGPEVVARLSHAQERARALSAPAAAWQQVLADGIQDLVSDVEYDLQARLRTVLREARDLVDESDPRETWENTQVWLRRQTASAGVANRDLLLRRAGELSDAVAEQFDLEAGTGLDLDLDQVTSTLEELELPSASTFVMPGGRLASLLVTARTAALPPMMAISLTGPFGLGLAVMAAAAGLGALVGSKLFRDEGRRQVGQRQAQAKAAASKFVESAAFEMNKSTRDGLRRTQRLLRDEFAHRASTMQASTGAALAAAGRAAALDPAEQRARSAALDAETRRLAVIRSTMREVSMAGAGAGAGHG